MTIFVNSKPFDLSGPSTLDLLLKYSGQSSTQGIAVAVNNEVIPKNEWGIFEVQENDKVIVITATQGG